MNDTKQKDSGDREKRSSSSSSSAEEKSIGKKQKHADCNYSGFASLPADVLVSILCRSPQSDHEALRNTCKAFRETIDSNEYKGERAMSGWAEVSTYLLAGEELYDRNNPDGPDDVSLSSSDDVDENATEEEREEALKQRRAEARANEIRDRYTELGTLDYDNFRIHIITMDIFVDSLRGGSINLLLFPRSNNYDYPFHEATDSWSSEMQRIGWTLCDSSGKLRIHSIKNAELIEGEASTGGFLNVEKVRVNEEYRPAGCSNIVAKALRLALLEPKLEGKWTLATAISDCNVYMSLEERILRFGSNQQEEQWKQRFWECSLLDTKTYLRLGFKQISETVGTEKFNPYWVFALPSFLTQPIKTFEEVHQTPLIEPPDLPAKPEGVNNVILQMIIRLGNSLRDLIDHNRKSNLEKEENERDFSALERNIVELQRHLEAGQPDHMSDECWRECIAQAEVANESFRSQKARMSATRQLECDFNRRLHDVTIPNTIDHIKTVINPLLERGGSVKKSFAIHWSSRLLLPQFVDTLIEMVPPEERAPAISTTMDHIGLTPLHCAVHGTPELHNRDDVVKIVEKLLSLGADTNVKSARGLTPLGQYRLTMSDKFDVRGLHGRIRRRTGDEISEWRTFHRKMEALLRPSRGETDVDIEAKCKVLDDEDDEEEDFDEEEDWMDEDGDE